MADETVQPEESRKVGKYDLIGVIAQGNSSQIWEATDGHQNWALKVLLPERLVEVEQRNVMKHEATVLKLMEHPSFVRFRESEVTKKIAYIAMEYFRAPNLKAQIASDALGVQARFPQLMEQICLALAYMHEKGWVHRDLKPDNILFNKAGELRLIDFSLSTKYKTGLAKVFAGKNKVIQGTRTYIAPETILKQQPSPQTDMYSLGITFYELLTGKTPFTGASPQDLLKKHVAERPVDPSWINENLTPDADQFIQRLLKKKPAERFGSANEMFAEARSVKFFKEDPAVMIEKKREADNAVKASADYEQVLDSRADAARTAAGIKLKPRDIKKKPVVPKKPEPAPAEKAPAPPQQPPMPQMPQYPPGYAMPPGYPYPPQPTGQGQPMYPMPQYPPGAYPYPPGYAPPHPGAAPPQQPQAQQPPQQSQPQPQPPQGQQPQPQPQQPQGQQPPAQHSRPQQPQPPQPGGQTPGPQTPAAAPGSPPAAPPQQSPPAAPAAERPADAEKTPPPEAEKKGKGDDLPLMDELPEVL